MNLESFYYQIVCATPPRDRFYAIQEIQDVIVVNFDCLYERECSIRGADQLIFLLHKQGHNKRFLFISEDGALVSLSGATEIIKNVIKTFGLTADTCCLVCREHVDIENCAVVTNDSIPYWCRVLHPYIKNISISTGPFGKKFAVWFHRGTVYRLELAQHLLENHKEDSFISYQESGVIVDRNLAQYFDDEIIWAKQNAPIVYDYLFPNRVFDFDMIVGSVRKPYSNYAIEIVVETDIISTDWITEKTIKNLYIGKPFLVFSGVGTLAKLHEFGFKTFSPWIDERYDLEENVYLRLQAIKQEVNRLAQIDINNLYLEIMPILEHNRKTYENLISRG